VTNFKSQSANHWSEKALPQPEISIANGEKPQINSTAFPLLPETTSSHTTS